MKYPDHKMKRRIRMEIEERHAREIDHLRMMEGAPGRTVEMLPPYAYTPMCQDPKYRVGKEEGEK